MPPLPGSPVQASPAAPNPPGTGSMSPHPIAAPATQPIRTPTGLPYGQNNQLRLAQKAMPLPTGSGSSPAVPVGTPGQSLLAHPQVVQAAQNWSPPTNPLGAPSQRPGEPVTTGVPTGPGAGPEALFTPQAPDPLYTGLSILNRMPSKSSESANLAAILEATLGNRMAQ